MDVIAALNAGRASELTAIHQYMAQHYELEDAGFDILAETVKRIALAEMKHAEQLALRILLLEGQPVTAPDGTAHTGEPIPALLATDMGLEQTAVQNYRRFAALCAEAGDAVSRDLFANLLEQEEQHLKEFETIRDFVQKLGQPYLVSLIGE